MRSTWGNCLPCLSVQQHHTKQPEHLIFVRWVGVASPSYKGTQQARLRWVVGARQMPAGAAWQRQGRLDSPCGTISLWPTPFDSSAARAQAIKSPAAPFHRQQGCCGCCLVTRLACILYWMYCCRGNAWINGVSNPALAPEVKLWLLR